MKYKDNRINKFIYKQFGLTLAQTSTEVIIHIHIKISTKKKQNEILNHSDQYWSSEQLRTTTHIGKSKTETKRERERDRHTD